MNKGRLITIVVALVIAWLVGSGQLQKAGPQQSDQSQQTQAAPAGDRAKQRSLGADEIAAQSLPSEARQVLTLIANGGPFPYNKDGTVFQNREKRLPDQERGFYREYTVKTPGASNRGARRIISGGQQVKRPDVLYYTADHYKTFKRIVEAGQ